MSKILICYQIDSKYLLCSWIHHIWLLVLVTELYNTTCNLKSNVSVWDTEDLKQILCWTNRWSILIFPQMNKLYNTEPQVLGWECYSDVMSTSSAAVETWGFLSQQLKQLIAAWCCKMRPPGVSINPMNLLNTRQCRRAWFQKNEPGWHLSTWKNISGFTITCYKYKWAVLSSRSTIIKFLALLCPISREWVLKKWLNL